MLGVSMCRVVWVRRRERRGGGGGLAGYQPGIYVPLKALFLVSNGKTVKCHLKEKTFNEMVKWTQHYKHFY